MHKSMIAGAVLAAATLIASPMIAWSQAQPQAPTAPSAPAESAPPGAGGAGQGPGMQHGAMPHGMMGQTQPMMMHHMMVGPGMEHGMMGQTEPMMMHQMMMRRAMAMRRLPLRQRCEDRLAHRAGLRAYVITKLDLTPAQRPLWDKLRGVLDSADAEQQQACNSLPASWVPSATLLDRLDWRERVMASRLDALRETKAPLQALYQALTPEQRSLVDHPFRHP